MRRYSLLLGVAVVLLAAFVGVTLKRGFDARKKLRATPTPNVRLGDQLAANAWVYSKDDPLTNKPIVRLVAQSIRATHDPSVFELADVALRLFDKDAATYTFVKSARAVFEEGPGILRSDGPVQILMHMPADKEPEDKAVAGKHVHVDTTGIVYETKTGKATTDKAARFVFPDGGGSAVGADYDPNTKILHLHAQVSLDWVGKGPAANKLHVETTDLVYKEAEQKIYLTPTAKLQRQGTNIQAANVVVALQDGRLHQIDGDQAVGTDDREDRHTGYSADKMMALFNENGTLVNIVGDHHAKVLSKQPESETTLVGDHADMRFATETKQVEGVDVEDSNLHLVLADGHAVAEAVPVKTPGKPVDTLADTRTLRSEHIELEMKPGGRDLQEIRTSSQAQLEFQPNKPGVPHRIVDASHLRVIYGEGSYVDQFLAWKVQTHTDKVPALSKNPAAGPPPPALTWSDELAAKFQTNSNQVASIEQTGNFRYQEGERKASAAKAYLDQVANRMKLTTGAHVADETGSTIADEILMNQTSGDMDANGHVVSTHAPNKNQKPGTSMLDDSESMQAKADHMITRDSNTRIRYEGHAVLWQGANRTLASTIDIDREAQTLHAAGNVVSELLDKKSESAKEDASAAKEKKSPSANAEPPRPPIFTTVFAPELNYSDDKRVAHYTGGVKMTRDKTIVTAKELTAYLTPKTEGSDDSSLDHAVAAGGVTVYDMRVNNRQRTGTGEQCEYFPKDGKVVLTGGSPRMLDSYKGVTEGTKLTYFSDEDHVVVDGGLKQVYTEMKKK